MKIITAVFAATISVSGCSALKTEANNVTVYYLESRIPTTCKKLGEVKVTAGSMLGQDSANATAVSDLKQKAYDVYNANTLLISSAGDSFGSVNFQGNAEGTAYNCPK